jgi:hypothetical protein
MSRERILIHPRPWDRMNRYMIKKGLKPAPAKLEPEIWFRCEACTHEQEEDTGCEICLRDHLIPFTRRPEVPRPLPPPRKKRR